MKKYILPGIAVLFSGVIIYQTVIIQITKNDMKSLEQQMMELRDLNVSLQQDISNIDGNIQETINNELGKSHLTKDIKFKLNKNIKDGYDLNVRAELKELKEGSQVLFMYKEESSNEWKQLELKEIGELSYSGDFDLDYEKSYQYKIILKGSDTQSTDVEPIEKYEFMPDLPECNWYDNGTGITIDAHDNNYHGEERKDKIKKVEFITSYNKKERTYKAKYRESPIYEEGNSQVIDYDRRYEIEIPKEDCSGKLDYIKVKVTYDSGIIDISDITDSNN